MNRYSIFEKFYTLNNVLADSKKSIGLGLSLCKSIVEVHGGNIYVLDNYPKGSIFTFTLPATKINLNNGDPKLKYINLSSNTIEISFLNQTKKNM